MPKQKARQPGPFRVANPRDIPPGRYIIRNGDDRWYEGDLYDGPVSDRLIDGGFLVEVTDGEE